MVSGSEGIDAGFSGSGAPSVRGSVNKMLMTELARAEFIDRRENVLFVGNPGTGKSHLAIALAAAACAKGYRVRFFRVTELVTLLIEARDERALLGLKARLGKLDLLVLDEFGYVPASKVGPSCCSRSSRAPASERA